MFKRKYRTAWIGIAASLLGVTLGHSQSLYLPDSTVNLGNVNQGEVIEQRFALRNPSGSTVKIRIDGLSHPGMKVRMPQELLPGNTAWMTLTWDTKLVQGEMTAQAYLRFDESGPVPVTLSARVIPPIEILPYPAVFLSGFRDEGVTRTLEIVNHDAAPLNVIGVSGENSDAAISYSATLSTIEPGRRHQLRIALKSAAPAGRSQGVLLVSTDHARFPQIRVPVNLLVKEDVYINPESVDFGQIEGKAGSEESFLLTSRRSAIRILSITSDLPFLRVTGPRPDAAASTHEFRVEIVGESTPGFFSGTIHIKTDDPSFPELKSPVRGEVLR